MKLITEMTKEELEDEIICNEDGLCEMFEEAKLLKGDYSKEELVAITTKWIEQANEADRVISRRRRNAKILTTF